jgi:hypothetical protein
MRKLLLCLAVAMTAATASAQEATKPSIGLGANVGNGTIVVTVPINVGSALRVEPFLGYFQHRVTDDTNPIGVDKRWNSSLRLGAGVFMLQEVGQQVELVLGGRLAILRDAEGFKNKSSGTTISGDDSFYGFGLSAVGGADYYFSPRFALGVEAELGVESIEVATDVRNTDIFTASFVTAKVFFK